MQGAVGKLGLFDFMLVIIKTILYEGAVALHASMNFRKCLRGSKPWGDSRRSCNAFVLKKNVKLQPINQPTNQPTSLLPPGDMTT